MNGQCSHHLCYPDSPCAIGEMKKAKCRNWKSFVDEHLEESTPTDNEFSLFPWNGHLIGSDISNVSARGRPTLIALLGSSKAGKTTLLLTAYASLRIGRPLDLGEFAGSFTLAAWEELAAWMRPKIGRPGQFPPRTSSKSRQSAGLLHIAVRTKEESLRDILFTDAPGEWFDEWSRKADGELAGGARWIAENADAFLVFADSEKLAGEDRGLARGELTRLIGRLSTVVNDRPVGLVWAKNDITVPQNIRNAIDEIRKRAFRSASSWKATYKKPETVLEVISAIVDLAVQPRFIPRILEPVASNSPFLAFRGG